LNFLKSILSVQTSTSRVGLTLPESPYAPNWKLVLPVKCSVEGEVLRGYRILDCVEVQIRQSNSATIYCLNEPDISKSELIELVDLIVSGAAGAFNTGTLRGARRYYFDKMLSGIGPLYPILHDPYVEDIALDGPNEPLKVFYRFEGQGWLKTNVVIDDVSSSLLAKQLARRIRRPLSPAHPLVEGVTPEGHRVAIVLGTEVSRKGSSFVIRRRNVSPPSLPQLVRENVLSSLQAAYLWLLTELQGFIMIIGGMASGKSVGKDAHLVVRVNGVLRVTTIEDLWNMLVLRGHEIKSVGEMDVIESPNVEILTIAPNGVEWRKPRYIIRHHHTGGIYRVRTETGRVLEVTPDHSLLAWSVVYDRNGPAISLIPVKPTELGCKYSYLPYLKKLPLPAESESGDKESALRHAYLLGFFTAIGYRDNAICQSANSPLACAQMSANSLEVLLGAAPEAGVPSTKCPDSSRCVPWLRAGLGAVAGVVEGGLLPDFFWSKSERWRLAFLAGIIGAQGRVLSSECTIEIPTASRKLAYELLYAFASVDVHAYLRKEGAELLDRACYRILVPIEANRSAISTMASWLDPAKGQQIVNSIEKCSNCCRQSNIVPVEVNCAISLLAKGARCEEGVALDSKLASSGCKNECQSSNCIKRLLGDRLQEILPRGVGLDRVVAVEEDKYEGFVYDIEVPETENFEANGIFVHNTTLMQALLNMMPPTHRIVTIEDTPELHLVVENWDPLITRQVYSETGEARDITLFELSKFALRRRAEYLVIGEVRGEEAKMLAQAAATGHGSMCLEGGEEVFVLDLSSAHEPRVLKKPIGELVDDVLLGRRSLHSLKVLSVDLTRQSVAWQDVRRVYRVWTSTLVAIRTSGGIEVKATPDHPFPVVEGRRVKLKQASTLRPNDTLLLLNSDVAGEALGRGSLRPSDKGHSRLRGFLETDTIVEVSTRLLKEPIPTYDIELGDPHVFVHGSLLLSHNCTFHAHDVKSAVYRLMSEPISLKPSFVSLIWAFVQMRSLVPGVRRVTRVVEVVPRAPNRFALRRIFAWIPGEDAFTPETPAEVLSKSFRLKRAAAMLGTSPSNIEEELAARAELLSSLARKNVDSRELREYLKEYYRLRGGLKGGTLSKQD